MAGRSPAGPLMTEHRVIERMIALLAAEAESIATTGATDPGLIATATDFIKTYADRCHHGKEEDILFARLAVKPMDSALAADMEGLIQDHIYGRGIVRGLVDANDRYASGETGALPEIESALRKLADFYPVHIEKEDRHFFKPALECFNDIERAKMLADFDEFDRALIHEKYLGVVEAMEARSR